MIKLSAGDPYSSYRRGPRRAILRVEMRIFRVEMRFFIELLSPNSDFRCIEHTLCATLKHNVYSPQVGIRISRIRYRGSGFASCFSVLVSRFSYLGSRISVLISRFSILVSHISGFGFTISRLHDNALPAKMRSTGGGTPPACARRRKAGRRRPCGPRRNGMPPRDAD